jgi:hypothetical protein
MAYQAFRVTSLIVLRTFLNMETGYVVSFGERTVGLKNATIRMSVFASLKSHSIIIEQATLFNGFGSMSLRKQAAAG